MQTFDYKTEYVMGYIIEMKKSMIFDKSFSTKLSSVTKRLYSLLNASKWKSSHERAKAVVLALPRNETEMENWK